MYLVLFLFTSQAATDKGGVIFKASLFLLVQCDKHTLLVVLFPVEHSLEILCEVDVNSKFFSCTSVAAFEVEGSVTNWEDGDVVVSSQKSGASAKKKNDYN